MAALATDTFSSNATMGCGYGWADVVGTDANRASSVTFRLQPTKEQIKAIARAEQREQSLDACAWLSWAHHMETPPADGTPLRALARRPTQRRTATAVRNFRRAA